MRTPLLSGALALAVLTGCSSTPSPEAAQSLLRADVDALSAAAQKGSLASADAAATALRRDVTELRGKGSIDAARAQALNDQIARVLADLTPRAVPTAPSRPVATTPPPPQGEHGKEKGKGKGEGGDHQD
jgi:hypothetical protein